MKTQWTTRFENIITSLVTIWREYWLLRWTLVNMVGWSLALMAGVLCLRFFGLIGALMGGAMAGAIVAFAQSFMLPQIKSWPVTRKQWVIWSAIGGALATVPVYLLGFLALLHAQIGLFFMGGMFAGIISALQFRLLRYEYDDAALWWVLASIGGGMLCAPLTFTGINLVPIIGSLGPIIFGLLTGRAILMMNKSQSEYEAE